MTLKIIASAAVVLGGGYIGILFASTLAVRAKQLEQMRLAIEQIGFSISFLRLPVAEAVAGAGKSRDGAVGRVLSRVAEEIRKENISPAAAFERAVLKNRASLCLSKNDLEILADFAGNLGTGDEKSELSNINAACARLKLAQDEAEGDFYRRGRLWRGMGLLCGMLAVVLLF